MAQQEFITQTDQVITVAYNPYSRRAERIYPEDELRSGESVWQMYWCESAGRYVSIPE